MKRIFLLLTVVAMTALTGCSNDDDRVITDNDTIGLVFDINRSFASNGTIEFPFEQGEVFPGDVVLIYWMESTTPNGNPVWRLMPQTVTFEGGGFLTYNYDFDISEAIIYAESNLVLNSIPDYTVDQIFRIIVVPGQNPVIAKSASPTKTVDNKDYNAVVKAYGINDSNVQMR